MDTDEPPSKEEKGAVHPDWLEQSKSFSLSARQPVEVDQTSSGSSVSNLVLARIKDPCLPAANIAESGTSVYRGSVGIWYPAYMR